MLATWCRVCTLVPISLALINKFVLLADCTTSWWDLAASNFKCAALTVNMRVPAHQVACSPLMKWNSLPKNAVLQNFEIRHKFSRRSRSTRLCRWSCKLKNLNFWRQEVRPLNSWMGSHCCYPQQTTRFISPIYSVHFDSSWPSIRCHWLAAKCHDLVPPPLAPHTKSFHWFGALLNQATHLIGASFVGVLWQPNKRCNPSKSAAEFLH